MRVRVKAALRRLIKQVRCGFIYRKFRSYACVQDEFHTGYFREYIVVYERGFSNRHVKRVGRLFVRSAVAKIGQRFAISFEALGEQYYREILLGA